MDVLKLPGWRIWPAVAVGIQSKHDALHISIVYTVQTLSNHVMAAEFVDTLSVMLDSGLPAQKSHV
jgi:hypothetical protein